MSEKIWRDPAACYRAVYPLNAEFNGSVFYRNANNMSPLFSGSNLFLPGAGDGDYPSDDFVLVGDPTRSEWILAGAVSCFRSLSYFTAVRRNNRTVELRVEQPGIRPGETPEKLVVLRGNDWRELLVEYADRTARNMGAKQLNPEKNLVGYCSWYYYYGGITPADFLENADALAASDSVYGKGVVQLDSGYQPYHGDWLRLRNDWNIPLETIAKDVSEKGMTPGIWVAPVIASKASFLYRLHPEWFVTDDAGHVCEFTGWTAPPDNQWLCLDGSNPEVLAYLRDVFTSFWQMGFRYFKMDALGYGFAEGRRKDPAATAVSAFRQMLGTIREAVPDAYLVACSSPFMPVLGLVDGARVGCDTSAHWDCDREIPRNGDRHPGKPCIRNAWHDTITNWWMFDRYFRADPDVVMARQDRAEFTIKEARISAVGAILTGVAITSDHFGTIAPERRRILELAAALRMKSVRPLDWKPDVWPHCFGGTLDGKKALAIVNDCDCEMTFDLMQNGIAGMARELFSERSVSGVLTLGAHDAAVVVEL